MAKSSEKKRKRDSDLEEDTITRPSKKTQVEENGLLDAGAGASKSKNKKESKSGESRQMRSERKKKKDVNSKANIRRKREEAILDVPIEDKLAIGDDFVPLVDTPVAPTDIPAKGSSQGKPGKPKKSSPRSLRKAAKADKIESALVEEGLVEPTTGSNTVTSKSKTTTPTANTPARFICFVGNLPFSATTAQITQHFSKLAPKSIRHSTDKTTGKSKGFAFLEFDNYDRMKTCLKSYHQSVFDPAATEATGGEVKQAVGKHRKMQGRKLNVELTAGGGGNTTDRKAKIREKNQKLKEERAKRKEDEKKEIQTKLKKRREQSEKMKEKRGKQRTGANEVEVTGVGKPDADTRGDIHPSRLNRVAV